MFFRFLFYNNGSFYIEKKYLYIEFLIIDIFKFIMKIMWFNCKIFLKFIKYVFVKLVIRNNKV